MTDFRSKPQYTLGLSCYYHDAAACLIRDGEVVAVAAEERFSRLKHDARFPKESIAFCLRQAGIEAGQLTAVAFYEKPILKFDRILTSQMASWPHSRNVMQAAFPVWMRQKLWVREHIRQYVPYNGEIFFFEHHESHAASAFYPSPFLSAAILTIDGVGEWASASIGLGQGNNVELLQELHYPNSLGLLYAAVTAYLGFEPNDAEYKVMGAAAYGNPIYASALRAHIDLKPDGSFCLNPQIFSWEREPAHVVAQLALIFDGPPREPESVMTDRFWNVAASVQSVVEEIILCMATHAQKITGQRQLCLAGGVALNVVAHRKIRQSGLFDATWVQPAAGDDGGALGAALLVEHRVHKKEKRWTMTHAFLGPSYSDNLILKTLESHQLSYRYLNANELCQTTAHLLAEQRVVGWFQGAMEWGPRALGHRSILADPRRLENRDMVNRAVKFREVFRPFAPAVLEEHAGEWFASTQPEPFMNCVVSVTKKGLDAVTHVDGTARLQTVSAKTDPLFTQLLQSFYTETGCPVLLNTSFNVRGEPIVCTPEDAVRCFLKTDMAALVIGSYLVLKSIQSPA